MGRACSLPPAAALSPDGRTIYLAPRGRFTAYELATGRATTIPGPGTTRSIAASPDGKSVAFVATEDEPAGRHPSHFCERRPSAPTGLTIHGTGPIDVSRDGRRLVYGSGGQPRVEVWALDGFETALNA